MALGVIVRGHADAELRAMKFALTAYNPGAGVPSNPLFEMFVP